jgi:hypothetical protein
MQQYRPFPTCHGALRERGFRPGAFGFPARGEVALAWRTGSSSSFFDTFRMSRMARLKFRNSGVASNWVLGARAHANGRGRWPSSNSQSFHSRTSVSVISSSGFEGVSTESISTFDGSPKARSLAAKKFSPRNFNHLRFPLPKRLPPPLLFSNRERLALTGKPQQFSSCARSVALRWYWTPGGVAV